MPSAVERVVIDMIDVDFWICDAHDKAVHDEGYTARRRGLGAEGLGMWIPRRGPFVGSHKFVVGVVDYCTLIFGQIYVHTDNYN